MSNTRINPYWRDTEERGAISGFRSDTILDPICDNCFDMYNSIMKKHQPFYPRLGHIGFSMGRDYFDVKLLSFYSEQEFDLAWCQKYMIR